MPVAERLSEKYMLIAREVKPRGQMWNYEDITLSQGHLSVIVRENRAGAKDRGRRLTSTLLPCKSHLKRLSTVVFSAVGGFFILR